MLEWSAKLSVGIESIDLQHHYFIDLLNRLSIELEGDDTEYQALLIDELASFARQHFVGEENIMYRLGFPGLEHHRECHQQLLEKLNGQVGLYLLGMLEAGEITSYLAKWLVQHIVQEDQKISAFISKTKNA